MHGPKIAFVNDTSIYEKHFGCALVSQTFREQFCRTGLDLTLSLPRNFKADDHHSALSDADLVVINGEGTLHHDRHRHLLDLALRYPCVLVNCVYEQNSPHPGLAKMLYVSARESLSTAELERHGIEVRTTPDAMFGSSFLHAFPRSVPTLDIGCTDSVLKLYHRFGFIRVRRRIGFTPDTDTVAQYLATLCAHRRLCIGRFHAAVASTVLGIPFSTWDSNTWKTKGLMFDMGVPEYHFSDFATARQNVPTEFLHSMQDYRDTARARVASMFDDIAGIAHRIRR